MSQTCSLCGKTKPADALFCDDCSRRIRIDYEVDLPENKVPETGQARAEEEIPLTERGSEATAPQGTDVWLEAKQPATISNDTGAVPAKEEDDQMILATNLDMPTDSGFPPVIQPRRKKRAKAPLIILIAILLLAGAFLVYNETVRKENLERSGWEAALKLNSTGGYIAYMEAFPQGAHAEEAQDGLRRLKMEEASAWEQMRASGNTAELRDFLNRHPDSPYKPLIEKRLDSLSWMGALQVNTPDSYSDYLQQSERGELRGEYSIEARERYGMLHQSFPVEAEVLDKIQNTINGFFGALSGSNHEGAFQYLAPTVHRFFNSGAASRERITGELLMTRTRAQGATLSFTPDIEAVRYEQNSLEHYLVNVPLTKSYSKEGATERVPGYIVHLELNPDFQIISIHETKPYPNAS